MPVLHCATGEDGLRLTEQHSARRRPAPFTATLVSGFANVRASSTNVMRREAE